MDVYRKHALDLSEQAVRNCLEQLSGVTLQDLTHLQIGMAELAGLINVIKIRAELDIAERRLPQGGPQGRRRESGAA